jgi:hypothetical protein
MTNCEWRVASGLLLKGWKLDYIIYEVNKKGPLWISKAGLFIRHSPLGTSHY